MLPALTCATGGATPKTYFALSIVAWYSTASAFAGAAEDCAKAGSGRADAKKNMAREWRTGILQTEKRSEEHTSELQSHSDLVCRLLLEKKKKNKQQQYK